MRQTDSGKSAQESPAEANSEPTGKSGGNVPVSGYAAALAAEQEYLTMLYGLLDAARQRSEHELSSVRARGGAGGTHQARLERDVSAAEHEKRLAQLNLTERGLCFGRTDDENQMTLYVGRIGLRDDEYELKLIDWRAPAARPFYAATPRNPVGLIRRRHI
jgi:DNA helicase IV